jgi:hypothetical protein
MGHTPRDRSDPATNAPPALGRRGYARWLPMLSVGLVALFLVPAGGAAPLATHPAPAVAASTGQWAWGAYSNTTYSMEELGAYADSLNLTNGNLSATNAYVAALEELHAEQGAFVVVNASAPSNSTRAIHTSAIAIVNESGLVAVAGDLPAAGTYGPHSPVTLVNTTCYYAVRVLEISAYVVDANYSYVNGSLALANEQVKVWTGINTTVIAYDWPTYTANANGTTTLRYTTSAYVMLGWVGEVVNATFTPALTLVQAPLSVGKTWNATSNVSVAGWAAYAVAAAASNGATNSSTSSQGVTTLNASATVQFGFDVVGSQSVILPNGTQETGYTIAATENGASSGSYTLWDGLAVLPNANAPTAAPARPATVMDHQIAQATPTGPSMAIVSGSGFPLATSMGSGSSALDTAPVAPAASESRIESAGTPLAPASARTPSTASPPTGNATVPTVPTTTTTPKTPPTTTPPVTTPPATTPPVKPVGSTARPSPLTAVYLVAIIAAIAVGFLAIGLLRARRQP